MIGAKKQPFLQSAAYFIGRLLHKLFTVMLHGQGGGTHWEGGLCYFGNFMSNMGRQ
jgi:hypothetical protein